MSADGKLALADMRPVEISSEEDMLRVHRLRATCDAILVGGSTVVSDDPKLHVSPSRVPDPPALLKVVLDASGRVRAGARFLTSPGRAIVATVEPTAPELRRRLDGLAEVVAFGVGPRVDLPSLTAFLAREGVERLLVEGGGETIWEFISNGLVDEMSVYVGPMVIGGLDAPTPAGGEGVLCPEDIICLETVSVEQVGAGVWILYRVVRQG
jgi:2,5-diamino-6-(ribosylamino)-4(3H)-pyrimidinone 5'-phosphate reductase